MRKFLTVIARIIASFFAILFVIATILALFLSAIGWQLFNPKLYKSALVNQGIYEHLPNIVSEMLISTISTNPCDQNPLICENVSPELKNCFIQFLGNDRYLTLSGGQEQPSEVEKQSIQPCLDQYGTPELTSGSETGMPPFFKNMSASNWESLLTIIIPPVELKPMVENLVDQLFSYLNGGTTSVDLSLVSLKQRLLGQSGMDAVMQLLSAQPACTQEQFDLMAGSAGGGGELVFCNPPADQLDTVTPQIQEQLDAAVSQIPDSVQIIKPPLPGITSTNSGPFGNDPVKALRIVRLILRLSPLLPLVFLLLLTLFGVRSLKGWLRWWGIPFFFAGIFALAFGLAIDPGADWAWGTFISPRLPAFLPPNVADVGHNLASHLFHSISVQVVVTAIILVVLGLVAWIISSSIKRTRTTLQSPTPPPVISA
jgi:hypothetical protein